MPCSVGSATFSRDGQLITTVDEYGRVQMWNALTDEHKRTSDDVHGHTQWVKPATWSPDGQYLPSSWNPQDLNNN